MRVMFEFFRNLENEKICQNFLMFSKKTEVTEDPSG